MNVREGDPILSHDGICIVAYWAQSMEFKHGNYGNTVSMVYYAPMEVCDFWKNQSPAMQVAKVPRLDFSAVFEAPDRTYWRVSADAPDGWWNSQEFTLSPARSLAMGSAA